MGNRRWRNLAPSTATPHSFLWLFLLFLERVCLALFSCRDRNAEIERGGEGKKMRATMENCRGKNGYGKSKKGCWEKMRTFSLFLLRSFFGLELGMCPIPIWHARPVKIFSLFGAWGGEREAVVSSPFSPPCIHIIKLPSHQTTRGKRGERLH